ncbi:MAG: FHA domain-containing protein, partial [Myxococcales bacterium]
MPSLKWMVPQGRPRVFGIYKRVTSIGQAVANDVAIDAASLEPHHAQLVFDGRDFSVAVVDSGAVLSVNGKNKKKSKIFHNDKLTLGDIDLVFSLYDESSTSRDPNAEATDSHTSEIEGM